MTTPFPFVAGQVLTAAQLNDIQNLPISDKTASYTLLVGDVTKRTIMNSASATTITVDDSIFTVGDVIQVANKGAGTCTITAGAGVTINTSGSLDLAQYGGGYLLALSASTFTFFNLGGGVSYGVATGGSSSSITVGGINYTLLSFTTDDNLVVSKSGLFDVLMFGGGGGGGGSSAGNTTGGGGGAGGVIETTVYLNATTYAVDVGAGGTGATPNANTAATPGLGSSVGTAARSYGVSGGGQGGAYNGRSPGNGGCGGGGAGVNDAAFQPKGLSVSTVSGFDGGNGTLTNASGSGGGGGVTAAGANSVTTTGGAGGAGYDVNAFTGSGSLFKAGGGGGGGATGGAGGSSIGGVGGGTGVAGTAASANTASGGGGAGVGNLAGGNGGSGIVYIRFKV